MAGGAFYSIGGVSGRRIARWDGVDWSPLGPPGTGMDQDIHALTCYGDLLIAGGSFYNTPDGAANYIAKWDGLSWEPLGSGLSCAVVGLAVHEGGLYAGGCFTQAGGKPSYHIARWQDLLSGVPARGRDVGELQMIPGAPNPFSGTTQLSYSLPEPSRVVLTIHDVRGRLVKTLHNESQQEGSHTTVWGGTDRSGNQVAPGVYFARLQAGKDTKTCRIVLVR